MPEPHPWSLGSNWMGFSMSIGVLKASQVILIHRRGCEPTDLEKNNHDLSSKGTSHTFSEISTQGTRRSHWMVDSLPSWFDNLQNPC